MLDLYKEKNIYTKFVDNLDNALQTGKKGIQWFWLSTDSTLAEKELNILYLNAREKGIYLNPFRGAYYASYNKNLKIKNKGVMIGFLQTQE